MAGKHVFSLKNKRDCVGIVVALMMCALWCTVMWIQNQKTIDVWYKVSDPLTTEVMNEEKLPPSSREELERAIAHIRMRIGDAELCRVFNKSKKSELIDALLSGRSVVDLSSKKTKKLLIAWSENGFPAGSIAGNVAGIGLITGDPILIEGRMVAGMALNSGRILIYTHNLSFIDKNKTEVLMRLDGIFAHELGHQNDWTNDEQMTKSKRIFFLYEVLQGMRRRDAFFSPNDYTRSSEGEMIYGVHRGAREWWAQLCEYYLAAPNTFLDAYPRERALVEKWLPVPKNWDARAKQRWRMEVLTGTNKPTQ